MTVTTIVPGSAAPRSTRQSATTRHSEAVSWATARSLAHATAAAAPIVRSVALSQAIGLTLARPLRARTPLPAFDTAAMDGYALAGPGPWQLRGAVRAGTVWPRPLLPGECVEISTGAQLPAGASAVLPVEHAVVAGQTVIGTPHAEATHIRRAGEDAPAGAMLAPAGSRVSPAMVGLAATCGYDTLPVHPRPRVRILITGDELTHSGASGAGRVRDALAPMLPALVSDMGGEVCDVRHVPDRPAGSLASAVYPRADDTAQDDPAVIVVTGSTSVGVTDQLRPLLRARNATLVVDTVACRPGHPQLLAALGPNRWLVGLPGNPFAAFVAAHTLLAPLLAALSGRALPRLPMAPLTAETRRSGTATRLIPVRWHGADVRPIGGHRAAFLHGAALADALAAVAPGWEEGDAVPLVPIS